MILAEEDCYPQFHSKYFMSLKTQNETLLKSMPFIKKDLSEYKTCKGAALLRSKDIVNTLSKRGEIWDHVHNRKVSCLSSCSDQTNMVLTTQAQYPARPIFSTSSEFCMLMVKFVDQCKEQEKSTSLDENGYIHICSNITQLRPLIKAAIKRIDETLPTAFLDSDSTLLEKNEERDRLLGSLCEDYTVWSNVLEESREERGKWNGFKTDMYFYASENLMQVNVYIRDPFVSWFRRDEETSWISFISNVGGLMGLCMGFSVVSFCELLYYLILTLAYCIRGKRQISSKK